MADGQKLFIGIKDRKLWRALKPTSLRKSENIVIYLTNCFPD